MTRPTDDDPLLNVLAEAVRAHPAEPSPTEVHALRSVVARAALPSSVVPPRRGWIQRPVMVASVALALFGGGGAVAAAAGAPVPPPVRAVAHSIGLPVDSQEVVDAKDARHQLQHELNTGDATSIRQAAAELRQRLGLLDGGDRAQLDAKAGPLLAQADGADGEHDSSAPTGSTPQPSQGGSPTPPSRGGSDSQTDGNNTGQPADHPPTRPGPTTGSDQRNGGGTAAPTTADAGPNSEQSGRSGQSGE